MTCINSLQIRCKSDFIKYIYLLLWGTHSRRGKLVFQDPYLMLIYSCASSLSYLCHFFFFFIKNINIYKYIHIFNITPARHLINLITINTRKIHSSLAKNVYIIFLRSLVILYTHIFSIFRIHNNVIKLLPH